MRRLAPLVRQRFKDSDRPGQRAKRILETWGVDRGRVKKSGALLDRAYVKTVEAGQLGMRDWNEAERWLIAASREEHARQDRARRRRQSGVAVVVVVIRSARFVSDGPARLVQPKWRQ